MKNMFKTFGIIALVAVIGFAFIACDTGNNDKGLPSTNGSLTITGLEAYEGEYVFAQYYDISTGGANGLSAIAGGNPPSITCGQITGGEVTLKVYTYENYGAKVSGYSGSDLRTFNVYVFEKKDINPETAISTGSYIGAGSVTANFTNGVATTAYN
jgi:hypothetical protein